MFLICYLILYFSHFSYSYEKFHTTPRNAFNFQHNELSDNGFMKLQSPPSLPHAINSLNLQQKNNNKILKEDIDHISLQTQQLLNHRLLSVVEVNTESELQNSIISLSIINLMRNIKLNNSIIISNITSLKINGNSYEMDGNNNIGCMKISSSMNIHLNNLLFQNGYNDRGGGIYIFASSVILSNCIFRNNNAKVYGGGGYAIASSIMLTSSDFIINNSTWGGAFCFVYSNANLTNCSVLNNYAKIGGGLLVLNSNDFSLNNCTVHQNIGQSFPALLASKTNQVYIQDTTVSNHEASQFGSACSIEYCTLSISSSRFWNNNASTDIGGALIIFASNSSIVDTSFLNNSAFVSAGAVMAYSSTVLFKKSALTNNHVINDGGALLGSFVDTIFLKCSITNNTAHKGHAGGLIFVSTSTIKLIDCILAYNQGSIYGGAIYSSGFNVYVYIQSCLIYKNIAQSGGGIYITGGNVYISKTEIYENKGISSTFTIQNSSHNTCMTKGGCFYSGNFPEHYNNNEYCSYIANNHGIINSIFFETQIVNDYLTMDNQVYSGYSGPNLININKNDIIEWSTDQTFISTGFEICYNDAAYGGAIYLGGELSSLTIDNSSIYLNSATRKGGAFYQDGGRVVFNNVIMYDSSSELNGYEIYTSGGTFEAINLTIPKVAQDGVFEGSTAQGADCVSSCEAGYGGRCQISNSATSCYVNCVCDVCDAGTYNNVAGSTDSDDCTYCEAGHISSYGATSCVACAAGRFATNNASDTEGGLVTQVVEGATHCNECPAGYITASSGSFVCQACLAGTTSSQGDSNCTKCIAGKYSSAGASTCSSCESGKYSNTGSSGCTTCNTGYNSEEGSPSCELADEGYYLSPKDSTIIKPCPSHAECYGNDHAPVPLVGYWVDRSSYDYAGVIYQCNRLTCKGAAVNSSCWSRKQYNQTSKSKSSSTSSSSSITDEDYDEDSICGSNILMCNQGSFGPICGACKRGFTYRGELNKCGTCKDISTLRITLLSLVGIVFVALIVYHIFPENWTLVEWIDRFVQYLLSFESGSVKVLWVTYQIVLSTRWNLEIKFPYPFSAMFDYFSIFSLDFISVECINVKNRHYFDVLCWSIGPIILVFIIYIIYLIRYSILIKYPFFEGNQSKILRQHFCMFLLLTYLVLPPVSMKQFQNLNCIQLGAHSYIHVDTSVSCQSKEYHIFKPIIICFIGLYQSIPIIWMILLYRQKHYLCPQNQSIHLMTQEDHDIFIENRDKIIELLPLRFLYKDYKINKWWFEVSEMYRRIIFVSVLPIISSISATKASFGCILAVMSIVYFREEEPYVYEFTNVFAYLAQFIILLTFYGALSIETGVMLVFGLSDFGIGILLLICNLLTILFVLVMTWRRYNIKKVESRWRRVLTDIEFDIIASVMNDDENVHVDYCCSELTHNTSMIELPTTDGSSSGGGGSREKVYSISSSSHHSDRQSSHHHHQSHQQLLSQHLLNWKDVIITKKVGAGAFGEVFKGTCMGEPVAIKTMLDITKANVKDFRSEILLTATLRHPNIVNFVGACWNKELTCMVLEWVSKGSLTDFLDEHDSSAVGGGDGVTTAGRHALYWDDPLLRLTTDIARGMSYLHTKSYYDEQKEEIKQCIIHRDLKPENVLVSEYIAGKISDFGTSRAKDMDNNVLMTGVGTPLYVAPEIVRGEIYNEKVDVYSFGISLLMLCVQEPILEFINHRYILASEKTKLLKEKEKQQNQNQNINENNNNENENNENGINDTPRTIKKRKRPKTIKSLKLIRAMTEDGWRPVTEENIIEFAPPTINKLIIQCCSHDVNLRPSFIEILSILLIDCKKEVEESILVKRKSSATFTNGHHHHHRHLGSGGSGGSGSGSMKNVSVYQRKMSIFDSTYFNQNNDRKNSNIIINKNSISLNIKNELSLRKSNNISMELYDNKNKNKDDDDEEDIYRSGSINPMTLNNTYI